ncbi:MAG: dTMP kinase [Candidatus Woesearchaeota archaeon]|jgi:dTMP kinase
MKENKIFDPIETFKNKLIVVEGPDFSTKTTFIKLLSNYLNDIGIEHIKTFQPGDTSYGEEAKLIRELTKREDMSEQSALFLYLYDRIQNNKKIIRPALKDGKTVISDRWWYSTMAYQWTLPYIKNAFPWDEMVRMNKFASTWLEPDIGLFLVREDIDIKNQERKEIDKYDRVDKIRRIEISGIYERFYLEGKLKKVFIVENDPIATFESFLKMEERYSDTTKIREPRIKKELK